MLCQHELSSIHSVIEFLTDPTEIQCCLKSVYCDDALQKRKDRALNINRSSH